MPTGLAPYRFPSVTRVAIAWLVVQFGNAGVGARRPQAGEIPFRMVTPVTGSERPDKTNRCLTVSVHTFGSSYDQAEYESDLTDQRMTWMGPPLYAPQSVTITQGDASPLVVAPRSICTVQPPIWADYEDDLIFRFVGRYEICVGPIANP